MMKNIVINKEDLAFIRSLPDFDLIMFLSEINENGWPWAKKLLPMIKDALNEQHREESLS